MRVRETAEKLRNGRQDSSLMVEDFLDDIFWGVKRLDQHYGTAHQQGQENPDTKHETMKHREQNHKAIRLDRSQHLAAALNIGQQIAVAEHGALWPASGAGRVNKQGQVACRRGGEWS